MFTNCNTPHETKKLYRKLAMENHPDLGGNTRAMQDINEAYHDMLAMMSGQTHLGSDGKSHKYTYSHKVEQAVIDALGRALGLNKPELRIELIGTWVWLSETKREDKDLYNKNGIGFLWHSKRAKWYFRVAGRRRQYNSNATMNELRSAYGSQTYEQPESGAAQIGA